jgi:cytochrome c biogenesis protein CcmG, thiol:disulfide interchange protein DsbE
MRLAIVVGLVGALAIAAALALPGARTSGRPAPALPKKALSGRPPTLASLRGRPAIVNFFASWCEPCVREAPQVERAYRRLAPGARMVAVDWSDGRSSALAFLRRFHWTLPVLEDPDGLVGERYGITGLPTTFVLDARGRIVKRLTGPLSATAILASVGRA